jgi:hypothetical protein
MTIALIAAGVIAFLAFDAFVMWKVFGSGNGADSHGRVSAPGEATLQLPAGKVKLSYQEHKYSHQTGRIEFDPPQGMQVAITPGEGRAPLDLERAAHHQAQTVASWLPGGPRSRVTLGHVEVPETGTYMVKVSGGGRGPRPQVLLGR